MSAIKSKTDESKTESATSVDTAMDINILYFASLADEAGCQQETVSVAQSTSLSQLYEQLRQKHGFSHSQQELRVAVNDYFAKWTDPINDGDSVVFITPVAGG
ncbi:MoaD/ThiS family protein [Psychrobacter sp. KFRI-CH2-11]|uniref:MoaD/ThiS family protein n=1 Tax=Psychrobacter sp. KFRI-CH2-11 TaxID=3156079 RepID=UPI0032541F86